MAEINVPTANPSNTQSGAVPSIPSRTRPATAPPTIGITMIAVTWPRILMSPSGVSCVIRVRLTAVGRAGVYRRPLNPAVRPLVVPANAAAFDISAVWRLSGCPGVVSPIYRFRGRPGRPFSGHQALCSLTYRRSVARTDAQATNQRPIGEGSPGAGIARAEARPDDVAHARRRTDAPDARAGEH